MAANIPFVLSYKKRVVLFRDVVSWPNMWISADYASKINREKASESGELRRLKHVVTVRRTDILNDGLIFTSTVSLQQLIE